MKLCILENDFVDAAVVDTYISYGSMVERLLQDAGANCSFEVFRTCDGIFPNSYDSYDAVLLTGSRADAFSDEPWVVQLRFHVQKLLKIKKKLLGICFGHQLIALCLGSRVGRAPQGWGLGRMTYQWHASEFFKTTLDAPQLPIEISLLASHQDQVFDLPEGATLLASSSFCPVAAFSVSNHVFCVQPHPEFVTEYSAYLLDKRRSTLTEEHYTLSCSSLNIPHDGQHVGRMMVAFIEGHIG